MPLQGMSAVFVELYLLLEVQLLDFKGELELLNCDFVLRLKFVPQIGRCQMFVVGDLRARLPLDAVFERN